MTTTCTDRLGYHLTDAQEKVLDEIETRETVHEIFGYFGSAVMRTDNDNAIVDRDGATRWQSIKSYWHHG